MLALLCCSLLLAARISATWNVPSPVEISSELAAQIRDVHAKVLEIWRVFTQQEADGGRGAALHAACQVQPSAGLDGAQPRVTGRVLFRQPAPGARLEAFFDLEGFPAELNSSKRAIHVHQFGDLSRGCESTGPHYNPRAVAHPDHPGDFGNFVVRDGRLSKFRAGLAASLSGAHSIVGRAVVVHAGEDDLGRGGNPASLENGNAGPRLACCVVGTIGPEAWASRWAQERDQRRKRRRESHCQAP
ncbi:extracellular superoxide dismutase [Cu-Zn] [Dipodomys spectabilis]|uniref:extracellular superoxide dismutase [Cu-Zn] n=1 Tax=Dipodomys spectabilis TaxID=105255 RepID=UPI001C545DEA|nr:extracellular superoxide dismutase [Cu-Zn] [Dipodomys spectabilis]XP_042530680.1 extracellular superoxide dismutase [Cu-Zn] [Dipodomys spectabilis]